MKTYKFAVEMDLNRELNDDELEEIEDRLFDVLCVADSNNEFVDNTKDLNCIHIVSYSVKE